MRVKALTGLTKPEPFAFDDLTMDFQKAPVLTQIDPTLLETDVSNQDYHDRRGVPCVWSIIRGNKEPIKLQAPSLYILDSKIKFCIFLLPAWLSCIQHLLFLEVLETLVISRVEIVMNANAIVKTLWANCSLSCLCMAGRSISKHCYAVETISNPNIISSRIQLPVGGTHTSSRASATALGADFDSGMSAAMLKTRLLDAPSVGFSGKPLLGDASRDRSTTSCLHGQYLRNSAPFWNSDTGPRAAPPNHYSTRTRVEPAFISYNALFCSLQLRPSPRCYLFPPGPTHNTQCLEGPPAVADLHR